MRDPVVEMERVRKVVLPATVRATIGSKDWHTNYNIRDAYQTEVAWAIPDDESLDEIASFVGDGRVIDVGCGHAFWSSLLKLRGVDVECVDLSPEHESRRHYCAHPENFTEVKYFENQDMITDYLHQQAPDVLMFIWPSYADSWAYDYLKAVMPDKMVYVGEASTGCTACGNFHKLRQNRYEYQYVAIHQFSSLHDGVYLCTKK